ncbi:bifunctional enzyme mbtA: salicyl-AMP ligase + salicyl-S-arcp synthetase [Mycolicibacterium canariasense]|uniref:Bifunctional enzyme mbtA: salicyl-AMP ligase + salicyl-S-arcp synthetase n=1 Tax=Mycolicibacterium canariasense TaxID=228230 RepID=A0A100W9S4_MYCCR|nr:AMP-binding protein [Mycolicibacterium canariasense]MCV7210260.1 AMP-binding protein [Mycolicibacterium canariasense]ORV04441.1 2,3-dihydroxybenzoate-AMP ligase [Mycolicibacterium canariasense]GAS94051.1 bifunctional enzyme mbtA: salicyl-AMP ligase + salicyl-S-arcp synthetase [Mycolicibacterium canariasense]
MTLTTPQPAESAAQTTLVAGFRPFPADRAAHYRAAGHWAGQTIDEILRTAAATWSGNIAVADAASAHTFAELDELADRAAAGFAALGIAPGDRVLLQLPNSARFVVALFGMLRAGAVPVMCLPGHRLAELTHFAAVSDAVALVIADSAAGFDYRVMAEELVATHPTVRHVIVDGDPGPFLPWSALESAAAPPVVRPATDSPALLLVSGGTTGAPKLIPRTHDDYVYNFTASAQLCALTSDDVYLVALPAAHNFPLACPGLLGALSVGATTVFTTDPSPEAAFAVIDRHGVTVTALVPALAKLWTAACDWESLAPKGIRLLQVGGAKLGSDDAAALRAALTPGLQQVFGMAEGLLNYTRLGDSPELLDHTQGRPLSDLDELRVVDEAGHEVAPGVEGELLVRGPYTINGYFNAPQDNARSFSPDGFYRSGDRVRRLADGYLEVTGRVKDVITRGGETVSALDLEEHLITHPGIWAAAAVPLPDEFLGEKICAVVVFSGAPVSLADLNAYLDGRGVAAHSRPDTLVAMPSLPTTAVGKTDKKAIAAQLTR